MPIIRVETSLPSEQLSAAGNFGVDLSRFVAQTLDKPQERITVTVQSGCRMWRGGIDAPMIQLQIAAIGAVSTAEQNAIHAQKFTQFLHERTGLPIDRIFLLFIPIEAWQIGKNGTVRSHLDALESANHREEMPWVTVETSLSMLQLGEDFGPGLTKLLSETLNKAENMVLISFVTDRRMMCAGKPAAIMNVFLTATAVLGNAEKNAAYSRKITDFIREKTGLKDEEIFLLFSPIEHWQVGINGGILPP